MYPSMATLLGAFVLHTGVPMRHVSFLLHVYTLTNAIPVKYTPLCLHFSAMARTRHQRTLYPSYPLVLRKDRRSLPTSSVWSQIWLINNFPTNRRLLPFEEYITCQGDVNSVIRLVRMSPELAHLHLLSQFSFFTLTYLLLNISAVVQPAFFSLRHDEVAPTFSFWPEEVWHYYYNPNG